MISRNRLFLFCSAILFVISIVLLIWLIKPLPRVERTFIIPEVVFFNSDNSSNGLSYTLPAGIQARLVMPERVWLGSAAEIELIIDPMVGSGYIPPAFMENYNLIAEARIDWPLVELEPAHAVSQPFGLSHRIDFRWKIKPGDLGRTEGQFWFYFQLVSIQEENIDRQALLSAPVVVEILSILKLTQVQTTVAVCCLLVFSAFSMIRLVIKTDHSSSK